MLIQKRRENKAKKQKEVRYSRKFKNVYTYRSPQDRTRARDSKFLFANEERKFDFSLQFRAEIGSLPVGQGGACCESAFKAGKGVFILQRQVYFSLYKVISIDAIERSHHNMSGYV